MNAGEAVKEVAARTGFTMARIAALLGVTPQMVNGYVNRSKSMRASNMAAMCDAMGYDVVLVPRGSRLPQGSVVVGVQDDGE